MLPDSVRNEPVRETAALPPSDILFLLKITRNHMYKQLINTDEDLNSGSNNGLGSLNCNSIGTTLQANSLANAGLPFIGENTANRAKIGMHLTNFIIDYNKSLRTMSELPPTDNISSSNTVANVSQKPEYAMELKNDSVSASLVAVDTLEKINGDRVAGIDVNKLSVITITEIIRAMRYFTKKNQPYKSQQLFNYLQDINERISTIKQIKAENSSINTIYIPPTMHAELMNALIKMEKFSAAHAIFDSYIKSGGEPNIDCWTAKIKAFAYNKQPEEAVQTIDQLKKMNVELVPSMFTFVLKSFIDNRKLEEVGKFWLRMHREETAISIESFTCMIKHCAARGEVERAFFLVDEMKAYDIQPDLKVFHALITSCGKAPHFVNGYHDIIFDALALMEGTEIKPTSEIYAAVIHSFGQAGDAVAAEYYFWELRRKGFPVTESVYRALFVAYATSMLVGAKTRGIKGRYSRPKRPELTPLQKDYAQLGPQRVAEISKLFRFLSFMVSGSNNFNHFAL